MECNIVYHHDHIDLFNVIMFHANIDRIIVILNKFGIYVPLDSDNYLNEINISEYVFKAIQLQVSRVMLLIVIL